MDELRNDEMMRHLLDALDRGEDIGHYGRLVFVLVARHFLDEDQLVELLIKDSDTDEDKARVLVRQAAERNYNPPKREKILQYQREQAFPIVPNVEDPDCGNVYRNLKFPDGVYEHIEEYRETKLHA